MYKKWSFPLRISLVDVQETENVVTFKEEILNEKFHF